MHSWYDNNKSGPIRGDWYYKWVVCKKHSKFCVSSKFNKVIYIILKQKIFL